MNILRSFLPILTCCLLAVPVPNDVRAQGSESAQPDVVADSLGEEYLSIGAITKAVYDVISGPAGQRRDWDKFKSYFAPGARLIPLRQLPSGENLIRPLTVDEYPQMVDDYFFNNGFFEIEIARKTEQYGSIAHHFSTYESRTDPDDVEPFARGINSFQLMHDGTRWWVVTIFWQQESPEVPIPGMYLD